MTRVQDLIVISQKGQIIYCELEECSASNYLTLCSTMTRRLGECYATAKGITPALALADMKQKIDFHLGRTTDVISEVMNPCNTELISKEELAQIFSCKISVNGV